ncbi:MAG: hypothetical protein K8H88_17885 [Sandaracinaceae bacterium]|nr:hypothetical protein [Sandaracinaceae bacterium]
MSAQFVNRRIRFRGRGLLALLRDVAGNATAETVIMLPAFAIIWGGILYTYQRHETYVRMAQQTRADVWAHAFAACQDDPPGDTRITDSERDTQGFMSGVFDVMNLIPGFQFDEIEGNRDASVERPNVLGEGSSDMRHDLTVLCNEQTQEDQGLFDTMLGMFGVSF